MSTLVNEALPTVVYGETGQGKTTDIMAAAALAADQTGVVLTPKRSNLTSVERTLGLPIDSYYAIQPCNYLSDVLNFLRSYGRSYNVIVVDDLGRMCVATRRMAMDPTDAGPFTKPSRDGAAYVLDKCAAYAFLGGQIETLCALIEELSAAGVQTFFSSHEVDIKEQGELGQPKVVLSKPHSLGPELTHVTPIDPFMKTMKIGVRVMPDSKCPLAWKGSYVMDQFDPFYIMKDSLNVFAKRGPQNLAEHFRHAGRDVPRYVGYEWMEGWVEDVSKYMLDGTTVSAASKWLFEQPELLTTADVHLHWILRDAYARAVLRAPRGFTVK